MKTVANIIKKFKVHGTVANLPVYGCQRKMDPRLNRRIVWIVGEKPKTTAKEKPDELQSEGTSVSDRTNCCFLSVSGLHGKRPRRTSILKGKHTKAILEFAKMHVDKPQFFWENVLRIDESKLGLFCSSMFTDKKIYIIRKEHHTLPQYSPGGNGKLCWDFWNTLLSLLPLRPDPG